jgi:hypothetical protein
MTRRALLWAVAALLGLAVTAALTWSVSRLTRERIGLSSEPPSVVHGLAPSHLLPPGRAPGTGGSRPGQPRPPTGSGSGQIQTTAPSATPAPPLPPANPHPAPAGHGDDGGGGSGGPDD